MLLQVKFRRLHLVHESDHPLDLETATSYLDDVWSIEDDFLEVLDCRLVRIGRSYGLRVHYELMGDSCFRTLRSVESVEHFLTHSPSDYFEASPAVESWDADMGL